MKRLLLGTLGFLALGINAPVSAADMAVKARPPAPVIAPIYDWTCFYVGANGGWGSSHSCWDFLTPAGVAFAEGCRDRSGGLFGGQVGIAGKPVSGYSASKPKAIGRISATRA